MPILFVSASQAMDWIEDLFPSYHPNIRNFIYLRLGFFDRRLKWGSRLPKDD